MHKMYPKSLSLSHYWMYVCYSTHVKIALCVCACVCMCAYMCLVWYVYMRACVQALMAVLVCGMREGVCTACVCVFCMCVVRTACPYVDRCVPCTCALRTSIYVYMNTHHFTYVYL